MGTGGDDQGKHDDESLGRVGRCRVLVAVICVWPLLRWWRDRVGVASDGSGDSDGVGLEMATTWDNTHNESAEYTMLIPHFLVLTWVLAGVSFGTWSATFLVCWIRGGGVLGICLVLWGCVYSHFLSVGYTHA